ncbi:MAG: DUF1697 domain-containing protein [Clostridiales Family XIII bacterium]|jgi:uncharacterized protein (DUF1697 family)|nr:DUF1697 domain-containing protein [Clostridiales Family XIII bacterium]
MTKYISLLRGVNVGGKNKISMPELKTAFEKRGFENVVTYINSGNILFDSDLGLQEAKAACENLIEAGFGLNIAVGVITAGHLTDALDHAPEWWNRDADSRHNAIFAIPPATAEEIRAAVGEAKPEYESISCYGSVIFWSAPLKTFSRTRWSKVVQSKAVYHLITIRNANTTLKLAALAKGCNAK